MLYTLFYLLALLSYQHYSQHLKKYHYLLFAFGFFFLSWHSKLSAASLPFMLLLFDYFNQRKMSVRLLLEKLPFFLFMIFMTTKIFAYHASSGGNFNEVTGSFTLFDRFLMAGYSTAFYLLNFFAPFHLSSLHPYPVKVDGSLPTIYYLATAGVLLFAMGMLWVVIKFKAFRKEILFGMLFFVVGIAMFTHFVNIKGVVVVADRYSYLPYIGLALILGILLNRLLVSGRAAGRPRNWLKIILGAYLMLFAVLAFSRTFVWKDSFTLFTDVISKNPDVAYAYNNRGIAKKNVGDYVGALEDFNQAIRLDTMSSIFYNNRGTVLAIQKLYQSALADFDHALALKDNYHEAYFNRALVKKSMNDYDGLLADLDLAIKYKKIFPTAYYERALEKNRRHDRQGALADIALAIKARKGYAEAWFLSGNIKKDMLDHQGAIADYNRAIRYYPDYAEAYNNRGFSQNALQAFPAALQDLNKALELKPDFPEAHNNRGIALANMQRVQEAMADFDAAIRLRPGYTEAYNNRGNAKGVLKDYLGSIRDFDMVLALNPKDSVAMANRGSSKYNLNDQAGACRDWQKAYDMGFTNVSSLINNYCK
jgi:tetratricopeptide (TPR) repeat protein